MGKALVLNHKIKTMDIEKLERYRYAVSLTNLTESQIKSASRKRGLNKVRQMLMYFCYYELEMSLKEIGNEMGYRHHSTIISGRDVFKGVIQSKRKGNVEAQQYKYILKKYQEKYSDVSDNKYICVQSLAQSLIIQLTELEGKENLNPIQFAINEAKKAQLEKIINTIKSEYLPKKLLQTS